jgi:hypothetical protein
MGKIACAVMIVFSGMAAVTLAAKSALADERERLIGTWKLVEGMNEDLATGEKTNVYKGVAVGFITYGADGRIMAIVVDSGRKKPAGSVVT